MLNRRELLAALTAMALTPLANGEPQTMEKMDKLDKMEKMDQRLSVVTLGVKDLSASRKFYVDGLGWKPAFENNEIIFFQAGGMVFALFPRDQLAEDFHGDPATFGRASISLGYNVRTKSEVNPLIQRAAAAGATILKAPIDASWGGYSGYFGDPDGFAWEVAWNPQWHIAPDGSIHISA